MNSRCQEGDSKRFHFFRVLCLGVSGRMDEIKERKNKNTKRIHGREGREKEAREELRNGTKREGERTEEAACGARGGWPRERGNAACQPGSPRAGRKQNGDLLKCSLRGDSCVFSVRNDLAWEVE